MEATQTEAPLNRLTLSNIGGRDMQGRSGAEELFQEHLSEVLGNIRRLDTDATEERTITMKFKFKPNANRDAAHIEVTAQSKLASLNAANGIVALGFNHGEDIAVPLEPQLELFDKPKSPDLKKVPNPEPKSAAQ